MGELNEEGRKQAAGILLGGVPEVKIKDRKIGQSSLAHVSDVFYDR